jgi:hypothetical protein
MSKINTGRVILGGLEAGAIIFVINGVMNGIILKGALLDWVHGMGDLIHPPAQSVSMGLWTLMCLVYGVAGTWMYAAIRPRYRAGPRTALLAGLSLWAMSKLTVALDLIALGLIPGKIIVEQTLGGLVAIMLGVFCGAWAYRE